METHKTLPLFFISKGHFYARQNITIAISDVSKLQIHIWRLLANHET